VITALSLLVLELLTPNLSNFNRNDHLTTKKKVHRAQKHIASHCLGYDNIMQLQL